MYKNTQLGLGAISSPVDYRDHYASAVMDVGTFILPATLDTQLGPVQMQGKIPACVSHSIVDLMKLYFFKKTGRWINLSPRFLDTLAKRYDGQDRATGGTYPRLVLKLASIYGCATEDILPNDTSLPVLTYRDDSILTDAVFANAAKYKIPGYVSIALDFASQRQAMFLYGAISTLFSVGAEMYTPSWNPVDTDPLRTPNPPTSGHQMTPKGWTDGQYNKLRNEWSKDWASGGETRYDANAWIPFVHENWAIAAIPGDLADFLKKLPSPADFHYSWNVDLKYGDYSEDVKFAQIALMILGFLGPVLPQDLGHFGPKTSLAVAAYQKANKIVPFPSRIGPQTRGALNRQFAL